ncbi:MAG: hypothetical protein QGI60_01020 [archaeon]|jgi:hypothetical protein|nr:hypothetical protein [archaeon]
MPKKESPEIKKLKDTFSLFLSDTLTSSADPHGSREEFSKMSFDQLIAELSPHSKSSKLAREKKARAKSKPAKTR